MRKVDRRTAMIAFAGAGVGFALSGVLPSPGRSDPVYKKTNDLKPGEFTWHPERSPSGPVAVIVSIPDQRVHVYRNGIRIAVSTCSTGKPGHSTPTGVFTILEKDKNHHSSTYNNAPMPNMNRLTWNGVALHAGQLPGYPASHGCVRLPAKFSELLFTITHVGMPVILAGSHSDPKEVVHPGLVLGDYAHHEFDAVQGGLKGKKLPWQAEVTTADTSTAVIVSHGDMSITVLESGAIVAQGPATITNPERPLGRHVFMLNGTHEDSKGLSWHAISHHDHTGFDVGQPEEAVLQRIKANKPVLQAIQQRMHPGMVLITTELPAHPDTRTGDDFVLMNTETG
jgi:hypothetical protein